MRRPVGRQRDMIFEFPDRKNIDALIADQKACAEILKKDMEDQCLRRVYCRTNLAMVEGALFYFKSATYRFNEACLRPFMNIVTTFGISLHGPIFNDIVPPEEAELLLERVPDISGNGEVKRTRRFLDFKTNFKFTFRMVDRVFKTACTPDYDSVAEWCKLQEAVQTRNRITHPKDDTSLDITDSELEALAVGCQWFLDFGGEVFGQISDSVTRNEKELDTLEEKVLDVAVENMHEFLKIVDAQQEDPCDSE